MTKQSPYTVTIGTITDGPKFANTAEVMAYGELLTLAHKNESPVLDHTIYTEDGITMGKATLTCEVWAGGIYLAHAEYLEGAWVLTDSMIMTKEALAKLAQRHS